MDIISIFRSLVGCFGRGSRAKRWHYHAAVASCWVALGCHFDRTDRWATVQADASTDAHEPAVLCTVGDLACMGNLVRCVLDSAGGTQWKLEQDCQAEGKVCAPELKACKMCIPNQRRCDGQQILVCKQDGSGEEVVSTCGGDAHEACRGGFCVNLCDKAKEDRSNVGCEYWGVDLDNANIDATSNAAAQQYAIVVSNPQPDVPSRVVIEQDDGPVGGEPMRKVVGDTLVYPGNLHVFKLGPREVDGSPPGEYDTGPGTAITRAAFRISSSVPVVAYQFNPLDNVNVFSNDASLLKPIEAATHPNNQMTLQYVAMGWPQTIAHTNDPDTNFNQNDPTNLRAFLTIVAPRDDTRVRVTTSTQVVAGDGIPMTPRGGVVQATLQAFEVLNLETGDFNADFTGSLVEADQPVLVFSGSEASDAPYFNKLAERRCCADHLEEQIDPLRTAGKRFFAPHAPNRTAAVRRAGAKLLAVVPEPEYFRVLAVSDRPVTLKTTLPEPDNELHLPGRGAYLDLTVTGDFMLEADQPVMLGAVQASQNAAAVPTGLPGGDPSFIIVPPIEQYRSDYVFLTPDKYAFDFVTIVADATTQVRLDGVELMEFGCERAPADGLTSEERKSEIPLAWVYRCQLSFPQVLDDKEPPNNVLEGEQNDGVHRIQANAPVLALVYGFDNYVSYGYAAGTQLTEIVIR